MLNLIYLYTKPYDSKCLKFIVLIKFCLTKSLAPDVTLKLEDPAVYEGLACH